jgi:hypothetical protein
MEQWRRSSTITDFSTRWNSCLGRFRKTSPQGPFRSDLGGFQSRFTRCRGNKILLFLPGIEPQPVLLRCTGSYYQYSKGNEPLHGGGRLINNDSAVTVQLYHHEHGGDMFSETRGLTTAT